MKMKYPIVKKLLPPGKPTNRPMTSLSPQGLVIHETATPGATAENEYNYFKSAYRSGSAHYFIDPTVTLQIIPEDEQAWHAGATANKLFLSIEMCRPKGHDPQWFADVWERAVDLAADMCSRYGWNTDPIWSHDGISKRWGESDHDDPHEYLAEYGKTWADLLVAIDAEIKRRKEGEDVLKDAVVIYTKDDFWAGQDVSARLGNCAIFVRPENKSIPEDAMKAEHLVTVGGPKAGHPNETYLSGQDKYATAAAVGLWLSKN
jgi:N-acetylmuramoyl-L-alanine amidase